MLAIAFSLWGTDARYCVGAIRNAELIEKIYPGWKMVCYADRTVPEETTLKLARLGVELRKPKCSNGQFWRLFIASDPKVDRYLMRDCDSRLSQREAEAIKEWIESGKKVHVIADHPHHTPVMGGGLWGGTKDAVPNMAELIESYTKSQLKQDEEIYNTDQIFLRDMVWPMVKNDCLIHDLCYSHMRLRAKPFPAKFGDYRFVGERMDKNDKPWPFDWQQRLNYLEP